MIAGKDCNIVQSYVSYIAQKTRRIERVQPSVFSLLKNRLVEDGLNLVDRRIPCAKQIKCKQLNRTLSLLSVMQS
jgi:hypothetical protein